MDAAQIVRTASALDFDDAESMLAFARMLAEHCAQIAQECPGGCTAIDAAATIRASFGLIGRT